jgi:hypothetical protein
MKYNIIVISCILIGFYALNTCAKPNLPSLQKKAYYQTKQRLPRYIKKLNINLPSPSQHKITKRNNKKRSTETAIILAKAKKKSSSIRNLFVLRATKNAVLKAVLKKKSYGLRYTRVW